MHAISLTVVVIGFQSSLGSVNENGEGVFANVQILHGALHRNVVLPVISVDDQASEGLVSSTAKML